MHPSEETLHAWLDEALSPQESLTVQAHVQTCAACRTRLQRIQAVFTALEQLPEARLSRDLAPLVLQALPAPQMLPLPSLVVQVLVSLLALAWGATRLQPAWPSINLRTFWVTWMTWRPPHWEITTLPNFSLHAETSLVWILFVCTLLLGAAGNALLLRSSSHSRRRMP
ncbi:MAG: hypothetical protein D6755_12190 [Anaerolineae bacterium]|nr:MAG: hypothetical protein D6755_12190 [Anaerolineae bacterium]